MDSWGTSDVVVNSPDLKPLQNALGTFKKEYNGLTCRITSTSMCKWGLLASRLNKFCYYAQSEI